jgi:hypothetical protein
VFEHEGFAESMRGLFENYCRIEATSHEPASHHPHPETFVAPTGFALEGLRYAKRLYKKTTRGRARDAKQELHNARRP